MPDFLFTEFSSQNINANTALVTTSGRSTKGIASSSYIADGLANAALFSAHPHFVAQSANGRYFRALGDAGAIFVDVGGATGDGVTNDQPAIQAAIAYAEAVGIRQVLFSAMTYRLHCPIRTSDPAGHIGEHLYDGHPLIVSSAMTLRSVRHGGSRLSFRHTDGSDRGANFQLVASPSTGSPQVWRGGGIFIKCPTNAPLNYADRPGITLEDITLDGGAAQTSNYAWPADPATGDGWDVTDKGIWVEGDRWSGDIRLIRSAIVGFRGELIYQAGNGLGNGEIYIRSGVLGETNGNLFQSCGSNIDIDGLHGFKAFQAFEGWSGRRGRLVNAVFEDCVSTGGLCGGRPGESQRNAPTRMPDGQVPWLTVDAQFKDCGIVRFGSWVRGRVQLTDCQLMMDGDEVFKFGLSDVDLDVVSHVDKRAGLAGVILLGSATRGGQSLSDIKIRLHCSPTKSGRAAGIKHLQPVDYRGSMGRSVVIEHSSGEAQRPSGPSGSPPSAVLDNYPCFRFNRWLRNAPDWSQANQNMHAYSEIVPRGDLMAVYSDTPGNWPIALPVANIQHGHELTICNVSDAANATLAQSGAGAVTAGDRTICPGQRITLQFDQENSLWRETASPL